MKRMYIFWSLFLGIIVPVFLFQISRVLFVHWGGVNEPLHSMFETLGFFASILLAIILLQQLNQQKKSSFNILISSALIAMGLMDGFHAAMGSGNTFVWTHSIAVLTGGLLFSLIALPLGEITIKKSWRIPVVIAAFSIVVGLFSIFFPGSLPKMIHEGNFTQTAIVINVLGGSLFILASINLLVRLWNNSNTLENLLTVFCLLVGISGLLFPFGNAWTVEWWMWHLLRLIGYFILLGYVLYVFSENVRITFRLTNDLRAASSYARNLIEASLDPLVTISAEGKITDVNNTTIKVTGVSREQLVGSDFADYFTESDKARAGYKQVFSQGIVLDYPLTLRNASGGTTDVLYNASIYRNEAGEVQGVFAAARDITERNKQEKELKTYRDQLEDMVKQRTADLSNVLLEVKETVNVISSSSAQILAATTQVASGTAETATAITETSTTVEEVQQAAKQSSEKAKNVANRAQQVAQVSKNGQKAVEETVTVMNHIREQMDSIAQTVVRLSEQSQSIGGIIASVTDIADQSNLLAVNAAIEAAKAGEQGKGFAVVAQEIKNLAAQSKQATSEVRNILNDVQKATSAAVMATEQGTKAVAAGVKQSAQAGESIRILAESSNEAVQAATQIVASSQQQVVGMDQIGVAIQNINQAGTETAVSMVQSEKSAKNLHELGQKLKDLVERFKE